MDFTRIRKTPKCEILKPRKFTERERPQSGNKPRIWVKPRVVGGTSDNCVALCLVWMAEHSMSAWL